MRARSFTCDHAVMADDVFLITGASSGIGAETARQAAQA
jgi:short-subunit dehydrogenase